MELFAKLFDSLLVFVYHCFDRIVIHGYLSGLSRPEQVVYFFRDVVGVPVVDKNRPQSANRQVSAMGRGVRSQSPHPRRMGPKRCPQRGLRPALALRRMERAGRCGRLFHFSEHGAGRHFPYAPFPSSLPRIPTIGFSASSAAGTRITTSTCGMKPWARWSLRVASFFPFQTTYYLNGHSFIEQELIRKKVGFRKNDNAFLAVDDPDALQAAADRLSPKIIRAAPGILDADSGPEVLQAGSAPP